MLKIHKYTKPCPSRLITARSQIITDITRKKSIYYNTPHVLSNQFLTNIISILLKLNMFQ